MKAWQFFLLVSVIVNAQHLGPVTSTIMGAVALIAGLVSAWKDL